MQIFSNLGMEQMDVDFQSMFEQIMPKQSATAAAPDQAKPAASCSNRRPRPSSTSQCVTEKAVELVENQGIIFLDELDKVCGPGNRRTAPTCRGRACSATCCRWSRARRSTRATARCSTDHILFIAAGAFHLSKPSDLMPELQGRFPIRVELTDLKREDFLRILTEPKHSLDQAIRRSCWPPKA